MVNKTTLFKMLINVSFQRIFRVFKEQKISNSGVSVKKIFPPFMTSHSKEDRCCHRIFKIYYVLCQNALKAMTLRTPVRSVIVNKLVIKY